MRRPKSQVIPTILILLVSLAAAVAVTLLVPSLSAASLNMLFRFRGQLPPPEDIVIVAIDDESLQRVGNWPWPRSRMASVLDHITDAQAQAVGLDVIYAEASNERDDQLLKEAIRRNARVVLPAQLTEFEATQAETQGTSQWLLPLPDIRAAAASTGHAHADPDVDGVLRSVQLSKADARGSRLWAFGLETLRVATELPASEIKELPDSLRVGRYEIATHDEAEASTIPGVQVIRQNEMLINYLGPPKTFRYYSIHDVIDGKIPASAFHHKIVLIGAVAQTMGDTRITPFISYASNAGQSGVGMPGIEVHANIIETIRRGAWLTRRSDLLGFSLALLVILAAYAIVRLFDGWREILLLTGLLGLIITGSLYVFNHYFIIPPVVPMLTGFFMAVPLLLLNSSITASRDLDQKLDKLARIQKRFMSRKGQQDSFQTTLSFLAAILRADSVALFQKTSANQALQLRAHFGDVPVDGAAIETNDGEEDASHLVRVPLVYESDAFGLLLVRRERGEPFTESERALAHRIALGLAGEVRAAEGQNSKLPSSSLPVSLPQNLTWKLRAVDEITAHLIARVGFMNQVFTSMTEGLLVADITGHVIFANPAAQRFWNSLEPDALMGLSLTELFIERSIFDADALRETMQGVMEGQNVIRDVELQGGEGRFYTLQFSAVMAGDNQAREFAEPIEHSKTVMPTSSQVIGLIVIITDVTKRRELDRVKAETLQLVSHELRTPLTSIRALSELLLKYPVPEDESPEILRTLYAEALRMNELINRYLDVTRIESSAQPIARRPVQMNNLIAECVRVTGGLAAEKRIQIKQKLAEGLPTILGDEQLLTQAVNNLLSNAIKYSPLDSVVEIGSAWEESNVSVYARDYGFGIPREFQERVFEKFFRLERDAKSETVGTGLGLALVKEIVERHQGEVRLESEPHKGSTFTIQLPLQRS